MDFRDAELSKQDDAEPAEDIECDEENEIEYAVDDSPMQASLRLFRHLADLGPYGQRKLLPGLPTLQFGLF